jgi:ATP-binding cassette subfamily B protein RaxB
LSDIALETEDPATVGIQTVPRKVLGEILGKDIEFRYSPFDPAVLTGLNFHIRPGEHVAITGRSGAGKTTLGKIMLGFVAPTSGTLMIDGVDISAGKMGSLRGGIAAVLQDDTLFAGTLLSNIALFDLEPDLDQVEWAAKAAAIHEEIMGMPMAYETLVGDMGSSLSGGQRQRVMLARALYRKPKILIIDEGTSHLDPEREGLVSDAIANLGITRVVIAHRRETVVRADRVIEIRDGAAYEL